MGISIIDNKNTLLRDDLIKAIKVGSRIDVAAAYFSIYAFQELRDQLETVEQFRFIFTSPTFATDAPKKEKREFYIPRLERERSLYGTQFEVKLRNELSQKAVARECAEWIRHKAVFKSNVTNEQIQGFIGVDDSSYHPINGFTTVDLGVEQGNNAFSIITKMDAPESQIFLNAFASLWSNDEKLKVITGEVIDNITAMYNENSPEFIYFVTLYNIFSEFLEDISEDVLPNEATGFKSSKIWSMLYDFQKDAALAIINKLERYNGCILADSVGLGKTFTALSVIKYYESRNKTVLVLCPKKLAENWNTYRHNYKNNPLLKDRLRYDVLYHTDLSRTHGTTNGDIDLARINWGNYDLVVIDESHNFRNGGVVDFDDDDEDGRDGQNRYANLMNKVIRSGVKTKVLMLSATPVNNRFNDLKNQLALAYEGHAHEINDRLHTESGIDKIFRDAQGAFNNWVKEEPGLRTTEGLLKSLSFDFFELLDSVTIARSRKHIKKYYDIGSVGTFPVHLPPENRRPGLTDLPKAASYDDIFHMIGALNLAIYAPSYFILESKKAKYHDIFGDNEIYGFTQQTREFGLRRLMATNLIKRMESSVNSFRLTVMRVQAQIRNALGMIDSFERNSRGAAGIDEFAQDFEHDFDMDDLNNDSFMVSKNTAISIADMDWLSWQHMLRDDLAALDKIIEMIEPITAEHDSKLQELLHVLDEKMSRPFNDGNRKVLIFTAFSDTVDYLYRYVSVYMKDCYGMETAMITGSVDGRTTASLPRADFNTVLSCFSPVSKDRDTLDLKSPPDIDILIATDCISEGQNLQDCDCVINYDIHWNPVRIIQRFGRIDRIGSRWPQIKLINFWPDLELDAYLDLKSIVETRMKIVNITATGDGTPLNDGGKPDPDLEYRKKQLERLQNEVVEIEDMDTGISILDLGLNEFRLDLLEFRSTHPDLEHTPFGLHAVTAARSDERPGVIFVLKNRSGDIDIENKNRLHPFYMVYIGDDGEVVCDHLSPKKLLDMMRHICKDRREPIESAYRPFNKETRDGRNMKKYSDLLGKAISSIVAVGEQSELDGIFNGEFVHLKAGDIKGLDDFELICFLVVR